MSAVPIPQVVVPSIPGPSPDDVLKSRDQILELVNGRLVEKTMGAEASWIATAIYRSLFPATEGKRLGVLMVESFVQAFAGEPKRVRRPDLLFATNSHFPGGRIPLGTLRFIPELIVEVQSPHDGIDEVEARIEDYLDNGAKLVWLVMPRLRAIRVHRADGTIQRFRENDVMTGESVVPEFSVRVGDLLPPVETSGVEPAPAS